MKPKITVDKQDLAEINRAMADIQKIIKNGSNKSIVQLMRFILGSCRSQTPQSKKLRKIKTITKKIKGVSLTQVWMQQFLRGQEIWTRIENKDDPARIIKNRGLAKFTYNMAIRKMNVRPLTTVPTVNSAMAHKNSDVTKALYGAKPYIITRIKGYVAEIAPPGMVEIAIVKATNRWKSNEKKNLEKQVARRWNR